MLFRSTETTVAAGRSSLAPLAIAMFLLNVGRHQWKRFVIPIACGAALSYAAAHFLCNQTWEASGTMIYTAPPVPESQRGLYAPPDLNTLLSLVKSPDVLAGIREEFDLQVPDSLLDKLFKVTAPRNTQVINVSFTWAEPEKAAP